MKRITIMISILCFFITFLLIDVYCQSTNTNPLIVFCNVGQGDASLISFSNFQILIDAGKDRKVLDCLNKYMPFWDKQIEIFIGSHNDNDHIGGIEYILPKYRISYFYLNDVLGDELQSKTEKYAIILRKLSKGDEIKVSSYVTLRVIHPILSETLLSDNLPKLTELKKDKNNGSIVLLLDVQDVRFLYTGDIDSSVEQALIAKGLTEDIDILKVAHHGSKKGTSSYFLRSFDPEIAVVSSGKGNAYNHPNDELIDRLEAYQVKTFRTDIYGDIAVKITGLNNYQLSY